jgi:hypothetical protein
MTGTSQTRRVVVMRLDDLKVRRGSGVSKLSLCERLVKVTPELSRWYRWYAQVLLDLNIYPSAKFF